MPLKKRVEILFDEEEYRRLEEVARARGDSVGYLVREAVSQYVTLPEDAKRRAALEWLTQDHEGPVGSPEGIKQTIVDSMMEGIEKSLEVD